MPCSVVGIFPIFCVVPQLWREALDKVLPHKPCLNECRGPSVCDARFHTNTACATFGVSPSLSAGNVQGCSGLKFKFQVSRRVSVVCGVNVSRRTLPACDRQCSTERVAETPKVGTTSSCVFKASPLFFLPRVVLGNFVPNRSFFQGNGIRN